MLILNEDLLQNTVLHELEGLNMIITQESLFNIDQRCTNTLGKIKILLLIKCKQRSGRFKSTFISLETIQMKNLD